MAAVAPAREAGRPAEAVAAGATAKRLLGLPPSPPGAPRPRYLWQKWNSRACVPDAVFLQAQRFAPDHLHAVLDDEEEIMNATVGGCMPCLCG